MLNTYRVKSHFVTLPRRGQPCAAVVQTCSYELGRYKPDRYANGKIPHFGTSNQFKNMYKHKR